MPVLPENTRTLPPLGAAAGVVGWHADDVVRGSIPVHICQSSGGVTECPAWEGRGVGAEDYGLLAKKGAGGGKERKSQDEGAVHGSRCVMSIWLRDEGWATRRRL